MAEDCADPKDLVTRRAVSLKLAVTVRQMHKSFEKRAATIGVTRAQWTMIAVVSRRPGTTQREIAEALEMSEASAGRVIDKLCADGLLRRQPKEDDRRAYCIHLTENSGAILDRISALAAENEQVVFAGFDQADLERFSTYLDLLAANANPAKPA